MTASRPLTIAALRSGGLIVNYRCSSACGHCLYACSPRREAGYIKPEAARATLSKVRSLGCRAVHIGGGEPFLDFSGLKGVLEAAADAGVSIEYVETNSSWFTSEDSACGKLRELQSLGLDTLLISISPFHNEFIPYRKVLGVLSACRRAGMNAFPWLAEFGPEIASLGGDAPHPMSDYEARFGKDYLAGLMHRYGLTFGGRAVQTFSHVLPRKDAGTVAADAGSCHRLAEVSHFHVDLHGNYVPGLCAGLAIRVDDLGKPLDPEQYPILTRLYSGGVAALYDWARKERSFEPRAAGYVATCDLCLHIRSCLARASRVPSCELQPAGFYEAIQA